MAPISPASTSSVPHSHRRRPHLPLITYTECGRHTVLELEVKKDNGNRGRIFYKCPARKNDGSGCSFWYWEEEYADILKAIAEKEADKGEAVLVKEEKQIRRELGE